MAHLEPPDEARELGLEVVIEIDYTNHRGERRWRKIIPETRSLLFGETPDHKPAQWCFSAWDVEKQARRTFALANVHGFRKGGKLREGAPREDMSPETKIPMPLWKRLNALRLEVDGTIVDDIVSHVSAALAQEREQLAAIRRYVEPTSLVSTVDAVANLMAERDAAALRAQEAERQLAHVAGETGTGRGSKGEAK